MIQSNAPEGYICPICLGVHGVVNDHTLIRPSDVIYKDDKVTAFINSFFMGKNVGSVIIVPNEHFENLYTIQKNYAHRVIEMAQKIALAMKEVYKTDGTTTRQNSEPAGDQHAFHFHFHVFPRYKDDGFNNVKPEQKRLASPEERAAFAEKLRPALERQAS